MIANHLTVIGLGLIGGSLIRALREAGAAGRITGCDPDPRQGRYALDHKLIEVAESDPARAVAGAELVVIAVPVLRTGEVVRAIRAALPVGAILTDVGSTKQSVLADVRAVYDELPPWFVPAHPIAGTEKSGVANSLAGLFRNHRTILTPHAAQSRAALERVRDMWQAAGARVVEMDAARHDAIFAATSHLPHVLAYSFVDMLAGIDGHHEIFSNAGGGFRDFTRIASSSADMWHDIVRANAGPVLQLLDRQIGELQALRTLIAEGEWEALRVRFQRARDAREHYLGQIE